MHHSPIIYDGLDCYENGFFAPCLMVIPYKGQRLKIIQYLGGNQRYILPQVDSLLTENSFKSFTTTFKLTSKQTE